MLILLDMIEDFMSFKKSFSLLYLQLLFKILLLAIGHKKLSDTARYN